MLFTVREGWMSSTEIFTIVGIHRDYFGFIFLNLSCYRASLMKYVLLS